jgi:acetylglutamate kinase
MTAASHPAETLLRATAVARSLRGRILVVKLGGSAMEDPSATRGTLEAVVALQTLGVRLVLVHGGGKPIDRAMAAAGLEPKKVAGRRYTDDATLEIVVRVLGELNRGIVKQIADLGGAAHSVTKADEFPIRGERLLLPGLDLQPVELGRVGKPTSVAAFAPHDHIPVIPSLAVSSDDGGWLNVNADTAASAVAGALKAEACYFLTDTPGVLRDVKSPVSLIPRLTRSECEALIRDGVIAGGMIPKVEACFEALEAGAGKAVILDGRDRFALLARFVGDARAGTEIVP